MLLQFFPHNVPWWLLPSEKAIQPIVDLSLDTKEEIRGTSVLAMSGHHSKKNNFIEAVKEMKADSSTYVQERAQKVMEIIEGKNKKIQEQLKHADQDIRLFAALYFESHGVKSDLTAIQEAENSDPSDEVKYQLGKAIKAIKKRAAQKAATHTAAKKKATTKQPAKEIIPVQK